MTEAEFENITSTFLGPFIPIEHHEQHSNATAVDTDWQMDITSRMRGESFSLMDDQYVPPSRPRTPSVYSEPEEPPPPAAQFLGTWEPAMAERIKLRYQKIKKEKRPFMVALVGLPGGGKSVSSFLLASMLDEKKLSTFVTPHDGYHYPLEYLRTQRNADDLIYRRGAPDTFDPAALYRDLLRLRNGDEQIIKLPAFNHARADPEPDTHIFNRRQHKIVLCEGLYLLHNDDGWNEIANVFDLTIFLDTPLEVCLERVKIRNQCIPGYVRMIVNAQYGYFCFWTDTGLTHVFMPYTTDTRGNCRSYRDCGQSQCPQSARIPLSLRLHCARRRFLVQVDCGH